MPFLRIHCDIYAAAPPRKGHGKRSRGAVCLGLGNRVPEGLFAASGASWGFLGFCRGGRLDGEKTIALDRETGRRSRWHGPAWAFRRQSRRLAQS